MSEPPRSGKAEQGVDSSADSPAEGLKEILQGQPEECISAVIEHTSASRRVSLISLRGEEIRVMEGWPCLLLAETRDVRGLCLAAYARKGSLEAGKLTLMYCDIRAWARTFSLVFGESSLYLRTTRFRLAVGLIHPCPVLHIH